MKINNFWARIMSLCIALASIVVMSSCEGFEELLSSIPNQPNKEETQAPDEGEEETENPNDYLQGGSGSLTYTIEGRESTIVKLVGPSRAFIEIKQSCSYWVNGKMFKRVQPYASISVNVKNDAINLVPTEEIMAQLAETEAETSVDVGDTSVYHCRKSFALAGQQIDFNVDYEVHSLTSEIEMPYVKISEPRYIGYKDKTIRDTTVCYHDVVMQFEVELEVVGNSKPEARTLKFEVTSHAMPELVNTTYRKDIILELKPFAGGPMHTMRPVVYRSRTYSNGKVVTDAAALPVPFMTFDARPFIEPCFEPSLREALGEEYDISKLNIFVSDEYNLCPAKYYLKPIRRSDFPEKFEWWCHGSIVVPDLDSLEFHNNSSIGKMKTRQTTGDWDTYERFNNLDDPDKHIKFNPQKPVNGWYYKHILYSAFYRLCHNHYFEDGGSDGYRVRDYQIGAGYTDCFLYMDGQIFDFAEYRLKFDKDLSEYETDKIVRRRPLAATDEYGPGYVQSIVITGEYLGHHFTYGVVDSIYTFKR